MFKLKRAQPEQPGSDAPVDVDDPRAGQSGRPADAKPGGTGLEGLKSRVPPALTPKRRQTPPPDGETIRQQFETVRRYAAESGIAIGLEPRSATTEEPNRLLIGRDISFKGEIGECETLVVEGKVAANSKCRTLHVNETGLYDGEIEAETAEISGRVEGRIRVRGRLSIRAEGQVNGEITYGELDIATGGRLAGDIRHQPVEEKTAKAEPAAKTRPAAKFEPAAKSEPQAASEPVSPPVSPPASAVAEPASEAPSGLPNPFDIDPPAAPETPGADDSSASRDDTEQSTDTERSRIPVTVGVAGTRA
jgi:cytoskeletal protein CcmA (bactofilin family)